MQVHKTADLLCRRLLDLAPPFTMLSSPASLYGVAAGKQCERLLFAACLLRLSEAPAMLSAASAYRTFLICKLYPALHSWLGPYPVCQAALTMLWVAA